MSPTHALKPPKPASFPRVSGDEPVTFGAMTDLYMFSPRERG